MRYSHVLGSAVVLAAATAAQAGLTFSLVRTPISAAARAADPSGLQVGRSRTFDLMVTANGSDKWASGDLQFALSAGGTGALYSPAGGSDIEQTGVPANVLFDSYVSTAAKVNAPSLLGKAQYPVESGVGTYIFSTSVVDTAWGDLSAAANPQSSGRIARLTLAGTKGGTVKGRVGATNNTASATFNIVVPVAGDLNGDGSVDNEDINPFVLALTDLPAYQLAYPNVNLLWAGDMSDDGLFDNEDINPFVDVLVNGGPVPAALGALVPEPTSAAVVAAGLLGLVGRRRRI